MPSEPRESTLEDYLRILRRNQVLIALVAFVCATAALAVSLIQTATYEAHASVAVRNPNEALTLVGAPGFSGETPLQLASSHAQQIKRPEVVRRVKGQLRSPLTLASLSQSVDVSVDPNSALIDIVAHAQSGSEAAAIANAFARQDAALSTSQVRQQFARQARHLSEKLRTGNAGEDAASKAITADQISRLRALSSVAVPVEVSTTASAPSVPSSPRPVRNTFVGFIFGLLLGVGLAYGRDALDRRLRQPSEVKDLLDHPVVGHIPSEALGHAGPRTHATSDGLGPMAGADEESFRILRQNVHYLAIDDPLRTLLVTSPVAEDGKSTVAACLAVATAAAGKLTLLVECDLRRPVLGSRLGLADTPGLTDYLTGNADPQDIVQPVPGIPATSSNGDRSIGGSTPPLNEGKLVCITAGNPAPRPAELLAAERFQKFLAMVSETYESVILDSAPLLMVADSLEIVPHAAGILLCVRLGQTTRDQVRATQAAVDRLPAPPIGVVLTAAETAGYGYYGYYGARSEARL